MKQITYTKAKLESLKRQGCECLTIWARDTEDIKAGEVLHWHKSYKYVDNHAWYSGHTDVLSIDDAIKNTE